MLASTSLRALREGQIEYASGATAARRAALRRADRRLRIASTCAATTRSPTWRAGPGRHETSAEHDLAPSRTCALVRRAEAATALRRATPSEGACEARCCPRSSLGGGGGRSARAPKERASPRRRFSSSDTHRHWRTHCCRTSVRSPRRASPSARPQRAQDPARHPVEGIEETHCIATRLLNASRASMAECAGRGQDSPGAQSALAMVVVSLVALATASGAHADDASWLRVDAPAALESAAQLPLVEVRTSAGARSRRPRVRYRDRRLRQRGVAIGLGRDGDGESAATTCLLARLLRSQTSGRPGRTAARRDFDDKACFGAELVATRALLARLETGTPLSRRARRVLDQRACSRRRS